jgi:ATP-dependent protease ClpP protease subunit
MAELRIDGVIGEGFNTFDQIRERVNALNLEEGEALNVIINSPGGSVFEGYGIYNFLKSLKNELFMEGEGLVGSIATLIISAAKKENTSISEVSMFMIHRAMAPVMGNAEEMDKQSEILKTIDRTLIDVYSMRTGLAPENVLSMMSKETWLSGREAYDLGFVGELKNPIPKEAVATAFVKLYNQNEMSLKTFMARYLNEVDEEKKEEEVEATVKDEVEETKAEIVAEEDTEVIEEEKKEEEETEEMVSRAEFDALKNSVDKFAEIIEGILETSGKEASATAEKLDGIESEVLNKVEGKFKNLVASLPTSKAIPTEEEVISKEVNKDPYAAFKEEMAQINATAKANLRKL